MCGRTADRAGDVCIGNEFTKTQRCDGAPRGDAQLGAFKQQGHVETLEAAREICT